MVVLHLWPVQQNGTTDKAFFERTTIGKPELFLTPTVGCRIYALNPSRDQITYS